MVMAWASGRLDTGRMMRVWTTVWAGNFVGSVGLALIIFLSGHYMAANGEIGATAIKLACTRACCQPVRFSPASCVTYWYVSPCG